MNAESLKILLVDDEKDILEFLSYNLKKEGFIVFVANNGSQAVEIAGNEIPHIILLDVMMPGMDGIEVCEILRNNPKLSRTLIVFLSARNEDYSQIAGFTAGADDYITKPIKPRLLISRINALARRLEVSPGISEKNSPVLTVDNITVDIDKHIVEKDGAEILFPKKEFGLLVLLCSNPEKVFTREEIYSSIWGNDVIVGDRTIDVHIRKLREKLGDNYIKTIKGVGYRLKG